MKKLLTFGALSISATLLFTGCSQATNEEPMDHSMSEMTTPSQDAAFNAEDEMFISMMMVHHQQAVEMSETLLGKDNVPQEVSDLATEIKDAQAPEIATLDKWQDELGLKEGMNHAMGGEDGMVSSENLEKLAKAPGDQAGVLYLEQMIAHHEGAVKMAQEEVSAGKFQPAVDMAKDIVAVQDKEIALMKSLLANSNALEG